MGYLFRAVARTECWLNSSHCAWQGLKEFLQAVVSEPQAVPAGIVPTQTFGD